MMVKIDYTQIISLIFKKKERYKIDVVEVGRLLNRIRVWGLGSIEAIFLIYGFFIFLMGFVQIL